MKQDKKDKRIHILMVVCQLFLAVFVIYWLNSQFRREKGRLNVELTFFYLDTRNEIIDSILMNSYFSADQPGKKNIISLKKNNGAILQGNDSSIHPEPAEPNEMIGNKEEPDIFSRKMIMPVGPSPMDGPFMSEDYFDGRGFRNIASGGDRSMDSTRAIRSVMRKISSQIDTVVLKSRFQDKLRKAGMNFVVKWKYQSPEHPVAKAENVIIVRPRPDPFAFEALIYKYQGYLIARIMPQVIFGLILMLLTAIAFYLSYRSIKEHVILNSLRDEFISNITHELRTPVATLKVAIESLGKYNLKNDPQFLDEYLHIVDVETDRLEELIDRVLDNSRLENGSQHLNYVVFDINRIIMDAVDIMKTKAVKGSILTESTEKSINITGDPLFFKEIIINLLDNSIKYCDREPVITINSYREKEYAVIEVNDNGPGIPEEYHRKIFEKFFRLPTGNVHNVKGYGLGLSFVYQVVTHHKGTIEVRNLDPGCSFIIKIQTV